MNENEYPSNSHSSRIIKPSVAAAPASVSQPEQSDNRPAAEKAIEGTAVVKRKSVGSRFKNMFTGVSLKDIADDVVDQAIIPGIKGILRDAGDRALDRWLGNGFGGVVPRGAARTMVTNVAHVAYNKFSAPSPTVNVNARPDINRPPMPMSRRGQAIHDFEEIEFQTRQDASIVLNLMEDRLQQYGTVSVAEFYGWADVRGNFTDQNWGWRSLAGSGPTRNPRTGMFTLNLPMPVPLTD